MRIKEVKINSTKRTVIERTRKSLRKRDIYTFGYPIRVMNKHAGSTLPTGTTVVSGHIIGILVMPVPDPLSVTTD